MPVLENVQRAVQVPPETTPTAPRAVEINGSRHLT